MKKLDYLKKELMQFLNSFKLKFNFIQILLYDLLFYAIIVPSLLFIPNFLNKQGAKIDQSLLTQEAIMKATEVELQLFYSQLRNLVIAAVVGIAALLLIALLAWSLSRGLIYTKLLKKKFTSKYFKKFIGLNLVLGIALLVITPFLATLLKVQLIYLSLAILLIIAYFTTMIYIQFTKNNLIFASIGDGLSFGAKNILKLIIPIILIIIVGYILMKVSYNLPEISFAPLILVAAYMAWLRIYFINKVNQLA